MSKQTDAAYREGYEAHKRGHSTYACPYRGLSKSAENCRAAWYRGWHDSRKGVALPEQKTDD